MSHGRLIGFGVAGTRIEPLRRAALPFLSTHNSALAADEAFSHFRGEPTDDSASGRRYWRLSEQTAVALMFAVQHGTDANGTTGDFKIWGLKQWVDDAVAGSPEDYVGVPLARGRVTGGVAPCGVAGSEILVQPAAGNCRWARNIDLGAGVSGFDRTARSQVWHGSTIASSGAMAELWIDVAGCCGLYVQTSIASPCTATHVGAVLRSL